MSAAGNCYKCCFMEEVFCFELLFSPSQELNQTSTFLKSNSPIQTQRKLLSLSHFLSLPSPRPAGNFVTSENKVDKSSASFLNNASNFGFTLLSSCLNVILQLNTLTMQIHSVFCHQTIMHHSLPKLQLLLLARTQTSSHLASESADATVYLLSFLSRTLGYASLLHIFHRTACGIPTTLSRHETQQWRYQHGRSQKTSFTITLSLQLETW